MSKKADIVMPEFLKIIIAIACIVLLVFLATNLYGIVIKKTSIEQARATLEGIVEKVNSFENEEVTKTDYVIVSPKEWTLVGVEQKKSSGKCTSDNCLCFCKTEEYIEKTNEGMDFLIACSSVGICKDTKVAMTVAGVESEHIPTNIVLERDGEGVLIYMGNL